MVLGMWLTTQFLPVENTGEAENDFYVETKAAMFGASACGLLPSHYQPSSRAFQQPCRKLDLHPLGLLVQWVDFLPQKLSS